MCRPRDVILVLLTCVEVEDELLEKAGHPSFIPDKIVEARPAGARINEHGIVHQPAQLQHEVIKPVVEGLTRRASVARPLPRGSVVPATCVNVG
jgi:hypothetical protein